MIHLVFANRSNVGDWLSARGIRLLLGPHAVTEHLCDEPFVGATLAALARAAPNDTVVVGGGGLVMDYFTPLWEGLLALPELRLCLWGIGAVDHKAAPSLPPLDLVRAVAARAVVCRVRDQLTRELLAPLEVPEPVPCPSLVAVSPRAAAGRGVLHAANLTVVGENAYATMRQQAIAFATRTERAFCETNNRLQRGGEAELDAVLGLYELADVVVSSRLHGCLLAIAMGRRVLAVSGDRKLEATMAAAGLGAFVLQPHELDRLPQRLDELQQLEQQDAAMPFRAEAVRRNRIVAGEVLAAAGLAAPAPHLAPRRHARHRLAPEERA